MVPHAALSFTSTAALPGDRAAAHAHACNPQSCIAHMLLHGVRCWRHGMPFRGAGSVLYIEIKHWKSDKKRFSTLAWSSVPVDTLVDFSAGKVSTCVQVASQGAQQGRRPTATSSGRAAFSAGLVCIGHIPGLLLASRMRCGRWPASQQPGWGLPAPASPTSDPRSACGGGGCHMCRCAAGLWTCPCTKSPWTSQRSIPSG